MVLNHRSGWRRALGCLIATGVSLAVLGVLKQGALRDSLVSARVASLRTDLAAGRADFDRIPRLRSQAARLQLCDLRAPREAATNAGLQLADAVTVVTGREVAVVIYDHDLLPLLGTDISPAGAAGHATPRLSGDGLKRALRGEDPPPEFVDVGAGTQLVTGFPVRLEPGRPCAVAQLSAPMRPIEDVLAAERDLLIRAGGVALLLAVAVTLAAASVRRRPEGRQG